MTESTSGAVVAFVAFRKGRPNIATTSPTEQQCWSLLADDLYWAQLRDRPLRQLSIPQMQKLGYVVKLVTIGWDK